MEYRDRHALFCAHARAVLSGDAAETARIEQLVWPDHLLSHHAFAFALFATCVSDHFGEDLDRARLDILTEGVRRTAPGVSALKVEALIRACYDEPHLLMEAPQSEHPALIWAACRFIVGPDRTEEGLADLFDRADTTGRGTARGIFASSRMRAWRDEAGRIAPGRAE